MRRLRLKRRTPRIGSGFSRVTSGRGFAALGIQAVDSIVLYVQRLTTGSASTQISSGIMLAPGQLMPANIGQCRLLRNGVEVACYMEALQGRYYDGSVISLLVQYQTPETLTKSDTATLSSPNAATYEFRFTGSGVARSAYQASWRKDIPDGVWKPIPTHFKKDIGALFSPSIPIAEVTSVRWQRVDARYKHAVDWQWESAGRTVTGAESNPSVLGNSGPIEANQSGSPNQGSYYDVGEAQLKYWVRGGQTKDVERALRKISVTRNAYAANIFFGWWNMHSVRSMATMYWLTGVEAYRTTTLDVGYGNQNGYMDPRASVGGPGISEGRSDGRQLGWCLLAWMLGDTRTTWCDSTVTALQTADAWVTWCLSIQQADGHWPGMNDSAHAYQSNFMEAVRVMYLEMYRRFRGPSQVGGIDAAFVKQSNFLKTQFDATYSSYHYWSDWAAGDANVNIQSMRGLALMHLIIPSLGYRAGGNDVSHLTQMGAVLDMHYAQSPNGAVGIEDTGYVKQFTEDHYTYQDAMAVSDIATSGVV